MENAKRKIILAAVYELRNHLSPHSSLLLHEGEHSTPPGVLNLLRLCDHVIGQLSRIADTPNVDDLPAWTVDVSASVHANARRLEELHTVLELNELEVGAKHCHCSAVTDVEVRKIVCVCAASVVAAVSENAALVDCGLYSFWRHDARCRNGLLGLVAFCCL